MQCALKKQLAGRGKDKVNPKGFENESIPVSLQNHFVLTLYLSGLDNGISFFGRLFFQACQLFNGVQHGLPTFVAVPLKPIHT